MFKKSHRYFIENKCTGIKTNQEFSFISISFIRIAYTLPSILQHLIQMVHKVFPNPF